MGAVCENGENIYVSENVVQRVVEKLSVHNGDWEALHKVLWSESWFKPSERLRDLDNDGCNLRKLKDILEQESPPRLCFSTSGCFSSCHHN